MKMQFALISALALGASAGPATTQQGFIQQCGRASWYELTSQTANGETANPEGLTVAHKSLPFGTVVRVENLENGRQLQLRVNDRGPYIKGRIVDVTRAAAGRLGFQYQGTARVRISYVDQEATGTRRISCS